MTPRALAQTTDWSNDFSSEIKHIQEDTIKIALPGLAIFGFLLLVMIPNLPSPIYAIRITIASFIICLLVVALLNHSPDIATLLLLTGYLGTIFAVLMYESMPLVVFLLILPVGLSLIGLSRLAGFATAFFCSIIILILPPATLNWIPFLRFFSILAIWATVAMVFLTMRPMFTMVQWTWYGYKQSREALERARDYQVQLLQAMEDIKNANIQLLRLNQYANHMVEVAEDERRTKEQFVANVSHELRTPLNMIIGYSEMIVKEPNMYGRGLPPLLLADLSVVLRNSKHLSDLIDDVLDLSQIEAGQMAITKERMSLAEIIQSAVVAVTPLFTSKNLSLIMEFQEDLPFVFCDSTRIREVALNLLSNAGRYTEKGGVKVKVWREGEHIVVSVSDTGPGISIANQQKLFQPFQQLEHSRYRLNQGSGLGLSISKKFVELHDGKMWVESKPGEGSIFSFSLPIDPVIPLDKGALRWLNPEQPYEERARLPVTAPLEVRPRLVLVDQGMAFQRLLSRYFDQTEIVLADTLDIAFEELKKIPSQLFVINQPHIGSALEQIKQKDDLPYGVTTIICSVPGIPKVAEDLGVKDYLVKPISRDALLLSLDKLDRVIENILVVDDEPDAQQLFSRILTMADKGYRVLRAHNGKLALGLLMQERIDVIFLDLLMPEMNGYELINIIRKVSKLKDIPIILISALDPSSVPINSQALAITRTNGLSMFDLLACIKAIHGALINGKPSADPTL